MQGELVKSVQNTIFKMEQYETENNIGKDKPYCLKLRDATPLFIVFSFTGKGQKNTEEI